MSSQNNLDIWSHSIHLLPSTYEVVDAFLDIPISTIAVGAGVIFWVGILWIPLKGVDRRDTSANMMYGLFMCFSASALFIVPKVTSDGATNYIGVVVALLTIFLIAKFRWSYLGTKIKTFKEITTEDESK